MSTSTISTLDSLFSSAQAQEISDALDVIFIMFGGADRFYSVTGIWNLSFELVTKVSSGGSVDVACYTGNGVVELTTAVFNPAPLVSGWFIAHEVGHAFDFSLSGGNPRLYRSQAFVDHFVPKCWWARLWGLPGCILIPNAGCGGKAWAARVRNSGTTRRGEDNSAEDFADTFAVAYALAVTHQSLPYRSFNSQWRLDEVTRMINGLSVS
jgi:hypothetical protein